MTTTRSAVAEFDTRAVRSWLGSPGVELAHVGLSRAAAVPISPTKVGA
ncbi:MAG: hypothetical protein ACRDRR_19120 [Pseudonocardiaceae bacterium]